MKKKYVILIILGITLTTFLFSFVRVGTPIYEEYKNTNWMEEAKKDFKDDPEGLYNTFGIHKIEDLKPEHLTKSKIKMLLMASAFAGGIALIVTMAELMFPLGIVFIIYSVQKKSKHYQKGSLTFNKGHYFRDILKQYPADMLSYLYHLKFPQPDTTLAVLLQLEQKNYITMTPSEIRITGLQNKENLSLSEQYVLSHITNGRVSNMDLVEYQNLVKEEAKKEKLIITKDMPKKRLLIDFIISVIGYAICFAIFKFGIPYIETIDFGNNFFLVLGTMVVFMIVLLGLIFYPIVRLFSFLIIYMKFKYRFETYSKKGKELFYQMEGLDNFLRDFSMIKERTKEEMALWDEYFIYAVIFHQNPEFTKKYEGLLN